MTTTNHEAPGHSSVSYSDLYDMQLQYGKSLPWLEGLLTEIQHHRDDAEGDAIEHIKYLEGVLDKLDAEYDCYDDK